MGGSRGLMGREAFAKLRSMIDELLSKKQDKLLAIILKKTLELLHKYNCFNE